MADTRAVLCAAVGFPIFRACTVAEERAHQGCTSVVVCSRHALGITAPKECCCETHDKESAYVRERIHACTIYQLWDFPATTNCRNFLTNHLATLRRIEYPLSVPPIGEVQMFAYIKSDPIFYIEEGRANATPVVFLHGFPFSHEMWKEQLRAASAEHRTIAYDLRGHGKSYVGEAQFTVEHHVDDLIGLMDFWKIQKAVVVGLSMGGYITLRALERNPERFIAAVLCDTKSEYDTNEGRVKRFESMKAVREHGSAVFAEAFAKIVFAPETFTTNPAAVSFIKNIIKATPPLSIAGTLLALASRTDTTSSLSKIKVPTLILVGEKDVTTPPENSQMMHANIPGSELHIIPRAAHMSNLENPDVFNEHLMNFMRRVCRT